MTTHLDPLRIRRTLGRDTWTAPEPFGPDGWMLRTRSGPLASIIITVAEHEGREWVHASIARSDRMPDYEDLTHLHFAVWGRHGWAYQVFAPTTEHVNIHEQALHLWGRLDGADVLPAFAGLLPGGIKTI